MAAKQTLKRIALVALMGICSSHGALAEENAVSDNVLPELSGKTFRLEGAEVNLGGAPVVPERTHRFKYFAPDGKFYFWYVGTHVIKWGRWKVFTRKGTVRRAGEDSPQPFLHESLCFSSINAEPSEFDRRSCLHARELNRQVVDSKAGDVLELKSGRVPCRMCRSDTSFDEVLRQVRTR